MLAQAIRLPAINAKTFRPISHHLINCYLARVALAGRSGAAGENLPTFAVWLIPAKTCLNSSRTWRIQYNCLRW